MFKSNYPVFLFIVYTYRTSLYDVCISILINPIPIGLFLSNKEMGGPGFPPTHPYDFALRIEIGECDTCL